MKLNHIFLCVISLGLLVATNLCIGQPTIEWESCFGGTDYDYAYTVRQVNDGGYIVGGRSDSNDEDVTGNHGAADNWIIKLDSTGSMQWQKSIGGPGNDLNHSLETTNDNGYILAGYAQYDGGDVSGNHGSGTDDAWVLKLDSIGNIEWQKCYGGIGTDRGFSIWPTEDQGYVLAGYSGAVSDDVTSNNGDGDFWIIKLNATGGIEWQSSYGGSSNDHAHSVKPTRDNGYIVCGFTTSDDGDVTGFHGDYDYWVLKLDAQGDLEWQKTYGGSLEDRARSILPTGDDGYIVVGYSTSNDGDITDNHGGLFFECWVVKIDDNGNIQWQKALGGFDQDFGNDIQLTSDGGYIISGNSESNNGDVSGNHGAIDNWIVKLDASGNIEWQKSLGGTLDDWTESIQQTSDNGFIVAGGSRSEDGDVTGYHGGQNDFWVVKLSSSPTGINQARQTSFNLFPNPTKGQVRIEFEQKIEHGTLNIFNSTGQLIKSRKLNHMETFFQDLPTENGLYLLQIIDQNGLQSVQTIVKN